METVISHDDIHPYDHGLVQGKSSFTHVRFHSDTRQRLPHQYYFYFLQFNDITSIGTSSSLRYLAHSGYPLLIWFLDPAFGLFGLILYTTRLEHFNCLYTGDTSYTLCWAWEEQTSPDLRHGENKVVAS